MFFDEVWLMQVRGNKDRAEYQVQTQRSSIAECKSRLGCFDAVEPADFGHLIEKVAKFYDVGVESIWHPSH